MKSFRHSRNNRGAALVAVLSAIMVLAGVGAVLLSVSSARLTSANSLEGRLEAERVVVAFSDAMEGESIETIHRGAASTDQFEFRTTVVDEVTATVLLPIPTDILSAPRSTPVRSNQDPAKPGHLIWSLRYSEPIRTLGTLSYKRELMSSASFREATLRAEGTVWRVPAGSVRFLSSKSPLTLNDLAIEAFGPAIIIGSNAPEQLTATRTIVDVQGERATGGQNPEDNFFPLFETATRAGSFRVRIDSLDSMPAGFSIADIGGVKYPALDLGKFFGPTSVHVSGAAVASGLCIVGSTTPADEAQPISIAVAGPVFAVGSNHRYTIIATTSDQFGFFSQSIFNGSEHIVSTTSANDQLWRGHFFISRADPKIRLEENWTGQSLIINGSLHVTGGNFSKTGAGAASLRRITISEPVWDSFPNPFTFEFSHESFLTR